MVGKNIAEAIANKKVVEASNNQGETYYRVVAGSYKDRENAEERKRQLEIKGFAGVFLEAIKK